jgi:hypothetical protein
MYWLIIPISVLLLFIVTIFAINIEYRKARRLLTPQQRIEEDEALKNEGIIY